MKITIHYSAVSTIPVCIHRLRFIFFFKELFPTLSNMQHLKFKLVGRLTFIVFL